MNALKQIRKHLLQRPGHESSDILTRFVTALAAEAPFPLNELYQLDLQTFELAIELLRDWRLDRYYAERTRLVEDMLGDVLPTRLTQLGVGERELSEA